MEHRWSVRKSIQGSVAFGLPTLEKIHTALFDISLGGLAVASPRQLIEVNTVVTLAVELESNGLVSHHRLHAQVAYSDATRTGFLFIEPGNETWEVLRDMLYSPNHKFPGNTPGSGQTRAA